MDGLGAYHFAQGGSAPEDYCPTCGQRIPAHMQDGGLWNTVGSWLDPVKQKAAEALNALSLSNILGTPTQQAQAQEHIVSPQSALGKLGQALNPYTHGLTGALTGMIGSQFGGGEEGAGGIAGEKFEGTTGTDPASDLAQRQAEAARGRQIGQLPTTLGQQGAAPGQAALAADVQKPSPGLPGQAPTPQPMAPRTPTDIGPVPVSKFDPANLASGVGGGAPVRPPAGPAPTGSLWDVFTGGAPMQENYNPSSVSPWPQSKAGYSYYTPPSSISATGQASFPGWATSPPSPGQPAPKGILDFLNQGQTRADWWNSLSPQEQQTQMQDFLRRSTPPPMTQQAQKWNPMQEQINTGIGNLQKQLAQPGFEPRTAPLRRRPTTNVQGNEPIVGWNVPGDPLAEYGYAEGGLYGRMRSNMLHSLSGK